MTWRIGYSDQWQESQLVRIPPKWMLLVHRVSHLRETLKPKTLSYSFMSFFSRVLFPAPDGPLSTTGLGPAIAEGEVERRVQWRKQVGEAGEKMTHMHWILVAWVTIGPNLSVCTNTWLQKQFTTLQLVNMLRQESLDKMIRQRFFLKGGPDETKTSPTRGKAINGLAGRYVTMVQGQLLTNWRALLCRKKHKS